MQKVKNKDIEVLILSGTKKFILDLDPETKLEALAVITLLQTHPPSQSLVKLVDKNNRIFEARGASKDFWIRLFIFYFKPKNDISYIVVTNGYLKKEN